MAHEISTIPGAHGGFVTICEGAISWAKEINPKFAGGNSSFSDDNTLCNRLAGGVWVAAWEGGYFGYEASVIVEWRGASFGELRAKGVQAIFKGLQWWTNFLKNEQNLVKTASNLEISRKSVVKILAQGKEMGF